MEIIKRILVCVFILCGVAVLGLICGAGILAAVPGLRLFGITFVNTAGLDDYREAFEVSSSITANPDLLPTIFIDSADFNVNVITNYNLIEDNDDVNIIRVTMRRKMQGFSNSLDSNITPRFNISYDDVTKVVTIKVTHPQGLFLNKDTNLTVEIPKDISSGKVYSVKTKSNTGIATFGTEDNQLIVHNLHATCTNAKGNIVCKNVDIKNNVYLENFLGRVKINQNVAGTVQINSRVGTYELNNIGNLEVLASTVEGQSNNPSITVNTVNNVIYRAEIGKLNITEVKGSLDVETRSASINIDRCFGEVIYEGEGSNVTINQLGKNVVDTTIKHTIFLTDGRAQINHCYNALNVTTTKGSIDVRQCYAEICANSTYGSIYIEFGNGVTSSQNISQALKDYLTTYTGSLPSLEINTIQGTVDVRNIRNTVLIDSESSQISLHFLRVHKNNVVNSSGHQVRILVDSSEAFVTKVKRVESSNANFTVNFGNINLNSWPTEVDVNENVLVTNSAEDGINYKTTTLLLNSATQACENIIQVNNNNGIFHLARVN